MSYKFDPAARYAKSDEWVRLDGDTAVIGISDYAQNALSDVVYIELPGVGTHYAQGQQCATVESVKAASDIYAPLGGTVIAVNSALEDTPETVSYTHLRAHETPEHLVCRLLLAQKKYDPGTNPTPVRH